MRWFVSFRAAVGVLIVGGLALALSMPAGAAVDMYDGSWHYTIAPYLWAPTINGTLNLTAPGTLSNVGGGNLGGGLPSGTTVGVTLGPSDYLTHLNFGFLGYFEARKANWSIFTDLIYLSLSTQDSSVTTVNVGLGPIHIDPSFNTSTSTSFQDFLGTLAASYTLVHTDKGTLDVFAGAQYAQANATVNWSLVGPREAFPQSGSLSSSQSVLAGIAGIKGNVQLGQGKWFLPYYFDVGAGGFTTWQGMAGVGYAFSWGDVILTYRHLYMDIPNGGLTSGLTLSGPMLGVVWHL